jgi:2-dehydro-3-deoxy-L-rhamnonate dehydrogenase (NAD+)
MNRFEGQIAVVTGGARGIGYGIYRRLSSEGAQVIVWDIDTSDAEGPGETAICERVDMGAPEAVATAMQNVLDRFGRVDVFINNAGISGPVKALEEYELHEWEQVIDIDLNGVFLGCKAAVPPMKTQGYGRIVNVASIVGKEGVPYLAAYGAAKAGVIGLTKSLARELVETGILVNAVAPVMVETDLLNDMTDWHITNTKAKIPMGRFLQVDELAAIVAFAASPENSFTTGFTFDASGGRATY